MSNKGFLITETKLSVAKTLYSKTFYPVLFINSGAVSETPETRRQKF